MDPQYTQSFFNFWNEILKFIPKLIGAVIIFLIGWLISFVLEKVALKLFQVIRVDDLAKKTETNKALERIGVKAPASVILSKIVFWFFLIITLSAVIEVLNISQLSTLANNIVLYIPNLFVAVVILVLGLIGGKILYDVIKSAILASKIPDAAAKGVASVARWFVVIFAFMAALVQMKISPSLIQILFAGFVLMMAIAGGLAFGLGGRDKVKQWIDKLPW